MSLLGNEHGESGGDSGEHGGGEHDQSGPKIILFVFFGLFFGALLREINKKTKIPYTPMLLVLGIIFGYSRNSLGVFGEGVALISQMSPHMILLVFIPVLLFESAFNCQWHVFKKSLVNILLLAGPGVLWGAFIIAFIFKVFLGYGEEDLTWYQACALGCVLSATDPVAVVALLKQLGASVHFNHLVEGESLLNDGTAMVFFLLFMGLVKGEAPSVLGVVSNFIQLSIGGPILGLVIGFFVSFWMKKIIRDTVLSILITFLGAYLCFYLAEFQFHVSGILSVVTLGLFFSAVGKRKIYPESEHALHHVWSSIQYGSQTLIFMLTGIIVGINMIQQHTITAGDWFKMLLFWVLMICARVIMVMTFYPLLKKYGYGLTKKELIVLIYGGLRGALGMCLSLFVGVDHSLRLRFRELTVFYMCGMAMLTIVVNGLTCGYLVSYLQMIRIPQIKGKLLRKCLRLVLEETQLKLKELKSDNSVALAKWRKVEDNARVKELGGTYHERVSMIERQSKRQQIELRESFRQVSGSEVVQEIRFRFTRFLSRVAWEFYEEGQLSEESISLLNSACSIANDEIGVKLRYFDILNGFFDLDSIGWYLKFKDTPFIGAYCTRAAIHKIYDIYETSTVFIEACQQGVHRFEKEFPIQTDQLKYIFDEVHQNIELAEAFITQLENTYPKIIQAVHTERASTILLKSKKNSLKYLYNEGYVDDNEYADLRKEIDSKIMQIRGSNIHLDQIKFQEVFAHCPLFSQLSKQQITNLRMKTKEKSYPKGHTVVKKDQNIKNALILMSGSVKETYKGGMKQFYIVRSVGSVLCAYDYTYKEPSKFEVKARNSIKVLEIEESAINQLLNSNSEFKKMWFKGIFPYCQYLHPGIEEVKEHMSDKEAKRLVQISDVAVLDNNRVLDVYTGAFVFSGQVQSQGFTYVKGNYIGRQKEVKSLTPNSVILNFHPTKQLQRRSMVQDRLDD